ncbi:MAG: hypothetical protein M0030_13030, partial [Actinomycetota bacterium]|nr:hypothetical protein [Actinomycetota bacterium]
HQCAACWWEPGGEPHDDDSCEYEPDLPAERTGEYAILDWPHYEWMHECRFSGDAGDDGDDQRWVLAEYTIKPGAEEGFYDNLCEPTTIAECRKLAEEIDIGRMIGD